MNIEKNIHPSIIAALNGQKYEFKETEVTFDDGETLSIERFTFGDKEPTLLVAIKAIIELSENCELTGEFFLEAEEALNYVSERLSITNEQALMLSLVISDFANQHIDVTDFGRHLRCTPITLLPYLKEMDALEERGYIVCNHSGCRPSYRIPYYILEALNNNEVPEMNQLAGLTCEELINELDKIFDQRSEHELTYDGLMNRTKSLLSSNSELHFVEQMDSYNLNFNDRIVLLFIACFIARRAYRDGPAGPTFRLTKSMVQHPSTIAEGEEPSAAVRSHRICPRWRLWRSQCILLDDDGETCAFN